MLKEEGKKTKRGSDRARGCQTRINIGLAFSHWQELLEIKGCKTDTELAPFAVGLVNNISWLSMSCVVALA